MMSKLGFAVLTTLAQASEHQSTNALKPPSSQRNKDALGKCEAECSAAEGCSEKP